MPRVSNRASRNLNLKRLIRHSLLHQVVVDLLCLRLTQNVHRRCDLRQYLGLSVQMRFGKRKLMGRDHQVGCITLVRVLGRSMVVVGAGVGKQRAIKMRKSADF
jgi:hypothetical protein